MFLGRLAVGGKTLALMALAEPEPVAAAVGEMRTTRSPQRLVEKTASRRI